MLTPFEKNLEVWRQLWRVLERSDIIVQVTRAPILSPWQPIRLHRFLTKCMCSCSVTESTNPRPDTQTGACVAHAQICCCSVGH